MTSTLDRVAVKLESALGADSVSGQAADGKRTALVCSPKTAAQVSAILRICAEEKSAVSPFGGGTGVNVGNTARAACVAIDLRRLNRIIEHDHANLTVTVESGITLAALRDPLYSQQQFLPFDAPYPSKATLGGTVALNMNGPRRGFHGGVRDLVIGMKVALITGEQIKAGGKVVKNVAGYDMCKLFAGSLGTLGVMTEATVRVAPVAETAATLITSGAFKAIVEFVDGLAQSQLLPAAVVLMNSQQPDGSAKEWRTALWCEGLAENVARNTSDGETLAQRLRLGTEILRDQTHVDFWNNVCDFPLATERCVYRITLPRAAVANFLEALSAASGPLPALISDMAVGTVWLSWPANRHAVSVWPRLISLAATWRGHAVMFAAAPQFKEGHDVWGPPAPTYSLMRKIKQQFDPNGLLNPGRFVGGL